MPDLKHNCHKCNQHIDSSFATNTKIGTTILKSRSNLLCMHGEDSNSGTACWPVDCLEVLGSSPAFWASLHMFAKSETSHKTSESINNCIPLGGIIKLSKRFKLSVVSYHIHASFMPNIHEKKVAIYKTRPHYYLKIQFNDLKLHKGCPSWVY